MARSPEERATEVIDGTKLDDVAVRKQLYEGGQKAVDASTDPLIVMMRTVEPDAVAVHKRNEDEVDSVLRKNAGTIAKIHFAQGGLSVPPDATFTLRLSYGAVKGYEQNGKQIPWFTTMGGAFEHAAAHGSKPPYELPASWMKAKSSLNLKTVYDTASTPDIIGGNSGSPVINKDAEVVGIIFDGNIQSLPWNFVYDDVQGRSVATDSRAIIEALRKIYHADALADGVGGPGERQAGGTQRRGSRRRSRSRLPSAAAAAPLSCTNKRASISIREWTCGLNFLNALIRLSRIPMDCAATPTCGLQCQQVALWIFRPASRLSVAAVAR